MFGPILIEFFGPFVEGAKKVTIPECYLFAVGVSKCFGGGVANNQMYHSCTATSHHCIIIKLPDILHSNI